MAVLLRIADFCRVPSSGCKLGGENEIPGVEFCELCEWIQAVTARLLQDTCSHRQRTKEISAARSGVAEMGDRPQQRVAC